MPQNTSSAYNPDRKQIPPPRNSFSQKVAKLGLVEISDDGGVAVSPESPPLPPQHAPVVSHKGTVTCQMMETGDLASFVAAPYEHANAGRRAPSDVWERYFCARGVDPSSPFCRAFSSRLLLSPFRR